MYFHLKEDLFLETSDCRERRVRSSCYLPSSPLSSSELVDAFCAIILLVFLCFNDFPGSSLDIFSWLIACFASHFPTNSGVVCFPKGLPWPLFP